MGTLTGLASIATFILAIMVVGAIAVLGLTAAFVVPAMRVTRTDRLNRHVSIPSYYLHPVAAH
jgi:uncharacterized membrane protein